MKSLIDVVSAPADRAAVVRDVTSLIDREVSSKTGISGMAIKGGYKVVSKLKGGRMVPDVVDGLLDEFIEAIEPLHAAHRDGGSGSFAQYLRNNEADAVSGLLAITDKRAQTTSNGTLRKAYSKLRPVAETNVAAALGGLGDLVDKHCA